MQIDYREYKMVRQNVTQKSKSNRKYAKQNVDRCGFSRIFCMDLSNVNMKFCE